MPSVGLLPVQFREAFGPHPLEREAQSDLVTDDGDSAHLHATRGRTDSRMEGTCPFHAPRISQVIQGMKPVPDARCGRKDANGFRGPLAGKTLNALRLCCQLPIQAPVPFRG